MAGPHAIAGLMKWLRREEWRVSFEAWLDFHLGPVCAKAKVDVDKLPSLIGADTLMNLWGCVFEDFLTQEDHDGRNIVDDYLKRRGWKESATNKAYIAALRNSVMSLYEVSEIVPGQSFLARDLVRGGDPVQVSEHTATRQLKPWDRLGARVVRLASKSVIGGGVLHFDYNLSEELLKSVHLVLNKARKGTISAARKFGQGADAGSVGDGLTDTILLRTATPLFTEIWLDDALDRVLNPRMPEIRNNDGDEFLFTTVHYPLAPHATADAVRTALGALTALRQESDTFWNWIEDAKPPSMKSPIAAAPAGKTFSTFMDDGALVLGNVELKESELTLSVNSLARAERGQAMLTPILAGLVRTPLTESQTVEQSIASRPNPKKISPSGLSPEEERAIICQTLDRHYASLLDDKVPALGDMTPRQAAKTAKGREKLVAWLKYLENQSSKHDADNPMANYDFGWMWERLGISELRR